MPTITINETRLSVTEGTSVLEAALAADIYIPHICFHPDLQVFSAIDSAEKIYQGDEIIEGTSASDEDEGCRLCLVEVVGSPDLLRACETLVYEGMVILTESQQVLEARLIQLSRILANHPHACLNCAQRFGCALEPCSTNVVKEERCCKQFGNCELQKVAEYIGIKEDTPRYKPANLPVVEDQPLYKWDFNLCIGCTRCVRACNDLRGVGAIKAIYTNGRWEVGTTKPTLKESGCKFCGACVEVCPTGALLDKDLPSGEREKVLVPCRSACPAGIEIPRYIRLISQGKHNEAVAVIRETVPLPSILGHVCYHPCEDQCRRDEIDDPIAICALKLSAAERDEGIWKQRLSKVQPTGRKVAIVGSGPAGLTAAFFLKRKGHDVTIFEAASSPGGMLRYGIPAYRLPENVLDEEIQDIIDIGIEIKTGSPVGKGLTLSDLLNDGYDAALLAVGKQKSVTLDIEGSNLQGVVDGLEFLRSIRENQEVALEEPVIVIGGGNVAIDVARSARRLGIDNVQLVCLERREEMPAHDWEIEEALEEGISICNSLGPKRILGDNEAVCGAELMRCTSVFDQAGKFAPIYDPDDTTTIDAGTIILAIGQCFDADVLDDDTKSLLGSERQLNIKNKNGETAIQGLFACGDAAGDSVNVIEAIASARCAAMSIDSFMGGNGDLTQELSPALEPDAGIGSDDDFCNRMRVLEARLPAQERIQDFKPFVSPFDDEEALIEAGRCLQCDLRLGISAVVLPPDPWHSINLDEAEGLPESSGVYQLADENKKVIAIKGVENLRSAMLELVESTGSAVFFLWEKDPMFTKRESELIQQHLQQFGELPGAGTSTDDLDDLF